MAFPATAPDLRVEAFLAGQWRLAPVRQSSGVTVKQGRSDRSDESEATLDTVLDDRDGSWDPKNPMSSYFGDLDEGATVRCRWNLEAGDSFTGRTVSNGWGTSSDGLPWTTSGGVAGDYAVDTGQGKHTITAANSKRRTYLAGTSGAGAYEIRVDLPLEVPAFTSAIYGIMLHGLSPTTPDHATVDCQVTSAGAVRLAVRDTDDNSYLVAPFDVGTLVAGHTWTLVAQVEGNTIRGKLWDATSGSEPKGWQATSTPEPWASTATPTGWYGLRSQTGSGAGSHTFRYVNLRAYAPEFYGDVTRLVPRREGRDHYLDLGAHGLLSRLRQGDSPLRSALARAYSQGGATSLVAYWPCEDERGATTLASGLDGGQPMLFTGSPSLGAYSGFECSAPLLTTTADSRLSGVVPPYDSSAGRFTVRWLMRVPAGTANPTSVMTVHTTGSAQTWYVYYNGSGSLFVKIYAADGTTLYTGGGVGYNLDDRDVLVSWRFTQNGANIDWDLTVLNTDTGVAGSASATLNSQTLGAAIMVVGNRDFNLGGVTFGHIAIQAVTTGFLNELDDAVQAYRGEAAGRRAERLCLEEAVGFAFHGDLDRTAPMGPQLVGALPAQLKECIEADQASLTDCRGDSAVLFRTHGSQLNQTSTLVLTYDAPSSHLSGDFRPASDRFGLVNDVTVTQTRGTSRRAVVTDGSRGVTRAGRYDVGYTRNVATGDQAEQLAWLLATTGSYPGERFPTVELQLERAVLSGTPSLRLPAATLHVDDLVTVQTATTIRRYDPMPMIARGWVKTMNRYGYKLELSCAPGQPLQVFQLEHSTYGRLHSAGLVVAAAVDASSTALKTATTSGPLCSTDAADYPADISVLGERMTVNAVANELITYGAVGTAAHGDNASVTPGLPASLAAGNLLVGITAIRTTTGTANVPTGYVTLADFGFFKLVGKIAGSSESAPQFTYSGGAAGDTTSAQLARVAGQFYNINNLVVAKAGALNANAQNVAYPGLVMRTQDCLVLYLAWKQDDYTSATSPGTEIAEASTTTGNDQSLTWAYQIQTAAAHISPGSFTITGGASAISFGAVVALRCDRQAFTVTRNVNSLPGGKSHAVGEPIELATRTGWAYGGRAA